MDDARTEDVVPKPIKFTHSDTANSLRSIAVEVIEKLYAAGEKTQLELLAAHAQTKIAEIERKQNGETNESSKDNDYYGNQSWI